MKAIDRFYRSYIQHCQSHDVDTLFQLLNALHSLNDQLKAEYQIDFFDIPEFITLKVIRNHLHHAGDISEKVLFADFPDSNVSTDLLQMCLFKAEQLKEAMSAIFPKYKEEQEKIVNETVHYYSNYVNVAPAIFNVAAAIMVKLSEHRIEGESEEFHAVKSAVEKDIKMGVPIRVSGKLSCHIGAVNEVIEQICKSMKSNN